jgi:hypothetical protein
VAAATLVAVLALVLAGGGGVVYASADSLPGSPLYGVKRATEQVQLSFAPAGTKRAELLIKFAQRRLEEVQSLVEIKGQVDEEALAAIAEETELALEGVEKAPAQDKPALLDKLVSLTERQRAVLERVQAKAPEAAQKGLNRALEASQRGHERAREALEKGKPGWDVKPIGSPTPTKTPRPTHAPKATPAPRATHTPKPAHTPKPTKTPKPIRAPGERSQDQGKGEKSKGSDEGGGGPPAEPPGKSKDKGKDGGKPAELPGKGKDKDKSGGPPAGSPDKDKGGSKGKKNK